MIREADDLAMGTAYEAAESLLAFWTGPGALNPPLRELCGRLAQAVDPAGAFAAAAHDDLEGIRMRVAAAIWAACERDGRVLAILRQLTSHSRFVRWKGFPPGTPDTDRNDGRSARGTEWPVDAGPHDAGALGADEDRRPVGQQSAASRVDGILLAASDPSDLGRLRLGREEREIREALDLSPRRARWTVRSSPAMRLRDLTRALLETQPRILHFAGHGSEKGGLFLEDEVGRAHCVPPDALADLFRVIEGPLECVVLNACHAESQGRAISGSVPFVIGSPARLTDDAAIAFSIGFYQALGAGRDIRQAYSVGCVHMRGTGTGGLPLPVLIARD